MRLRQYPFFAVQSAGGNRKEKVFYDQVVLTWCSMLARAGRAP